MTTLEILQAYPLGTLPVAFTGCIPSGAVKNVLIGLVSDGRHKAQVAHYAEDGRRLGKSTGVHIGNITPILYSFADLTTPLPDGTVPAVEIGKAMYSRIYKAEMVTSHDGRSGRTCVMTGPGVEVSISEYGFNNGTLAAGLVDLLRERHFAPMVCGKPLVEGVDFIRKEQG